MANILINPNSGIMEFTTGTAGTSTFDAGITGGNRAARLSYDNFGSLNLTSYVSNVTGLDRFTVDGANGRLFSVTDNLSGSLFSVNDIAGLPIIEAFDDNTVIMGAYNRNDFVLTGNSLGIGAVPNTGTTKLLVSGNATISGNLNALGNYYVKVARLSDQTILQNADTIIQFSGISDPNNWYNSGTYRITPTIAGNYCVNLMASWKQGSAARNIQTNIQIRKAGNAFAISQVPVESGLNFSVYACGIVTLNGTTGDYVEATAYSANPTSQNLVGEVGGAWTKMELFKLN
jgi:hypothetical protein